MAAVTASEASAPVRGTDAGEVPRCAVLLMVLPLPAGQPSDPQALRARNRCRWSVIVLDATSLTVRRPRFKHMFEEMLDVSPFGR